MRRDELGAELQSPARFGVGLDDLNTLAGNLQLPVALFRLRKIRLQRCKAVLLRLQDLCEQVLGQSEIVARDGEHGFHVAWLNRLEQVEKRAVLEKLAGKAGVGTEQQGRLAVNDTGVEMWH